jgi:hypothetical protein
MNIATHFRFLVCVTALTSLSACSLTSTHIKSNPISDLQPIIQAYTETVRRAHDDDKYTWDNGRFGNILVNLDADSRRGLCFHWQKWVYIGIQPALANSDWKATGIAINEGSFFEHHAVLVYHPAKTSLDNILKNHDKLFSYVLDPWSSGEARVYSLNDWLQLPMTITAPARLTAIDTRPVYPPSL